MTILYADYQIEGDDMFVVTPEGNYFTFESTKYNESSPDTTIVDLDSHKTYTVRFNE